MTWLGQNLKLKELSWWMLLEVANLIGNYILCSHNPSKGKSVFKKVHRCCFDLSGLFSAVGDQ